MQRDHPGAETRDLRVLGFLILGAGLLFLFGPIILGFVVQSDSDILFYYYPLKSAIRSLWLNHQSLVWNPFLGEGQRLAGNPEHELFYPFSWLFFLFSVTRATAITEAIHFVAGWLGMRRLLRHLGCSEGAAILGAVAWGFGGIWISSTHFFPVFLGWTWVPWLAAGAAEGPATTLGAVRDSFFGALILLVGEPVTALSGALAYIAVFLRNPVTRERSYKALITFSFSVAMAAATLFPAAALARRSLRWSGFDRAVAEAKSFPIARTSEFIVPRATGNVVPRTDRDFFAWRLYPEKGWPFYPGIYSGVLLAPLALAGFLAEFRRNRPLLLVGVVAFVLALGTKGYLWGALRRILPLWRGVRYPEKLLALAVFLTVVLMAMGFDVAATSAKRSRLVATWLVSIGVVLVGATAFPQLWMPFLGGLVRDARITFQTVALRAAVAHLLFAVVFLLLGRFGQRRFLVPGFLTLAAIDVLSSSRDFIRTHSVDWMEKKPPVVVALEHSKLRPLPRVVDLLPEIAPVPVPGADEINGPWDRNRVLGDQLVQWGIPLALDVDYDYTYLAHTDRARRLLSRIAAIDTAEFGELLAQRSACALLVWKRPLTLEDPVGIVGVRGCRPEVDAATSVLNFRDDDEFLRVARENKGRLARAVFIEGPGPGTATPVSEAKVSRIVSRTNELSFQAECESPCFVRIARTNDVNWRAFLNARPIQTVTVNLSLIGIEIPAGTHRVELSYDDHLLRVSIWISAAAFLLAIAIIAWGARARLRRRRGIPRRQDGEPLVL